MKRYLQYDLLKIEHFTARRWRHPLHNHNHFELIFVHRGKGAHCLSGTHIPFDGPSLFLLSPGDVHRFVLETETEFTFIKFTEVYLQHMPNIQAPGAWNQGMDRLLAGARNQGMDRLLAGARNRGLDRLLTGARNRGMDRWRSGAATQRGSLLRSDADADKAERMCRLILEAKGDTVYFLIQALLSLARPQEAFTGKHADKVTGILQYIHQHIYCPAYTQAEHLAAVFGLSTHYLGPFFRTHTGVTLREYVGRYKCQLIQNRLLHSSLSIKEIAGELGFIDLSHFNKFFKAHMGVSPTRFRTEGVSKADVDPFSPPSKSTT